MTINQPEGKPHSLMQPPSHFLFDLIVMYSYPLLQEVHPDLQSGMVWQTHQEHCHSVSLAILTQGMHACLLVYLHALYNTIIASLECCACVVNQNFIRA